MTNNSTNANRQDVFIVDGSRTPFLKAEGGPGYFAAADLAVYAARPLLARQPFTAADFDSVVLGSTMPSPDEANIARVVALRLACGNGVPAWTVQRNCGSGMQSIDSGLREIESGRANLVLAGGTEAMSHAPLLFSQPMVKWLARFWSAKAVPAKLKLISQFRPGFLAPVIALLRGLTDPVVGLNMGQTAEEIAWRFDISRLQMDEYAVQSHQRLAAAQAAGRLGEIVEIYDDSGHYYDVDNGVRHDSSVEKLAKLRPVFDREVGKVTAGNSSQITDGAAWVILASAEAVEQHALSPLAKIVDTDWGGLSPAEMGLGPVHAMSPIMQRQKLAVSDVDYWELNEAFAGQVLACLAAWEDTDYCREQLGLDAAMGTIPADRMNVDGGAIALGHPVGTSGARIVLHLCHVLAHNKAKRGMASLCIGGGQGGAMLIERV